MDINFPSKWYQTVGCLALAAVGLATLGWYFGPPKKLETTNKTQKRSSDLREEEKKLQAIVQKLTQATSQENYNDAEKFAQEALSFTENIWGKQHINYGIIMGIPVASLYEQKKDYKKWANSLLISVSILKYHGDDMLMELGLLDKLLQCLPQIKEFSQAEEYAKMTIKLRKEALTKRPNDAETFMKFSISGRYVASFYTDVGMFKQAETLYTEILNAHLILDPSSHDAYLCLELYTNCLHQQGKTEEALKKLEDYKKKIEHYKDTTFIEIVQNILQRALTLSLLIDDYQLGYNYIQQIIKYNQENHLPTILQTNMDFATILFEFGNNEEAEKFISQVQSLPLPYNQIPPLVRTRYLTTIDCQVKSGVYKLTMRVNRLRPKRKEGDPVEDPEQVRRKLDHCFLRVFFQNTVPNSEPVIVEYTVDKPHEFIIESPPMPQIHKTNMWYKVHIDVYDNAKNKRLGIHEQPVYTFPLTEFKLI